MRVPGLTSTRSNLMAARRTRILDLTIVICLADVVCGIAAPTFTVFARGLGAGVVVGCHGVGKIIVITVIVLENGRMRC